MGWLAAGAVIITSELAFSAEPPSPTGPLSPQVPGQVVAVFRKACFECHGPERQEGGLRLDREASIRQGGDSGPVLISGDAENSELIARVSLGRDEDGVMPARGDTLTPDQIALLKTWINGGATWPAGVEDNRHWSYVPPVRPTVPEVRNASWPRTAIDSFILSRLEKDGIAPSPEADRPAFARRVYLDLLGLPPTPGEVDAFVADPAPDAYAKLVDRLLSSPQFGVRWARPWLDYARYADSHGFQRDDFRDLWAYRDWVVAAFNDDLPYDRFTVEQLAGDLLPDATEAQRIASGFNRNAPTNVEAGSDPEETRVNQVFDRVNTVGMVWLGTTLECCQCHDHKYDPFTMRDYYGLFAFFNQTAVEAERSNPKVPGSIRFLGPEMTLADQKVAAATAELKDKIAEVAAGLSRLEKQAAEPDPTWEAEMRQRIASAPQEHVLDIADVESMGGATHEILPDKSVLFTGEAPDRDTYRATVSTSLTDIRAFKLEALTDASLPGQGPGRGDAERPNFVLNSFALGVSPGDAEAFQPVRFASAAADFSQARFDVAGAIDDDPQTAWAINPKFHQAHWAVFNLEKPLGTGEALKLEFKLVQNYGNSRTMGRFRLSAITGDTNAKALAAEAIDALNVSPAERTKQHAQQLASLRLRENPRYQKLVNEKKKLEAELEKLKPPTTLVMQELESLRTTKMFSRGDFRSPGLEVAPSTPAVLTRLPAHNQPAADTSVADGAAANRLDLARWLVQPDHPLTARVAVNRWWAEIFGHGLVTTPEDFGLKGELPTHPELLDWLAIQYVEQGWSLKDLLREVVLSATYRQSSRVTPELLTRDDQNVLYARGPRVRLDAEAIRDNALAIAGLISFNQGGPPIRPYQPDGIWIKVGGQRYDYVVSEGEKRYRRGIYVVWKRGAPYPSFVNFDANNRLACRVQRPRSNTPLQALTLLNDPVYVEAAEALARRIVAESPGTSLLDRLDFAFRLAVSRSPSENERTVLRRLYEEQLAAMSEQQPTDASGDTGELPAELGITKAEFAAWCAVASALLNLDETISKG